MAVPVLAADAAAISAEASKDSLAAGETVTYTIAITGGAGLTGISFDLSLSGLEVTGYEIKCLGTGLFQESVTIGGETASLAAFNSNGDGTYSFYATGTESTSGVTKDAWTILTVTCKATKAVTDTAKALTLKNALLYKTETYTVDGKTAAKEVDVAVSLPVSYALGDVNGDDEVDIEDAALIAKYDIGIVSADRLVLSVGDVNGDGEVDIEDATLIAKYDIGLIAKLPAA
jgi:hypothetical protein